MSKALDAVVIGGGAAGLFCAIEAGKRGKRVVVVEHNSQVGRKILISGGGRCNFTNLEVTSENFISRNPRFCISALTRSTPQDFIGLVKKHRIPFYEKTLGQLFCRDSSRAIVGMLLDEAASARVDIRVSTSVKSVQRDPDGFLIETSVGALRAKKLVIACGGLSFAKIGATGFGYEIARQFGLRIEETRPSLVAMRLEGKAFGSLAGVSLDASVRSGGAEFRENILFTHSGLSGPAVLQISNYWSPKTDVNIDLLPGRDPAATLRERRASKRLAGNFLADILPKRLPSAILRGSLLAKRLDQLSDREIGEIAAALGDWRVKFAATEGYDRAEVTLGGVSTDELSSQTMECRRVPGLYFIGEVVDVTGWLGGYNFQWAWSSAYAAGSSI